MIKYHLQLHPQLPCHKKIRLRVPQTAAPCTLVTAVRFPCRIHRTRPMHESTIGIIHSHTRTQSNESFVTQEITVVPSREAMRAKNAVLSKNEV